MNLITSTRSSLSDPYWKVDDTIAAIKTYIEPDKKITTEAAKTYLEKSNLPKIKKVIFNDPATIIIWSDKSKTVVKCMEGDTWDPEKGFMAAYLTKILGHKRFHSELKKYVKPQVEMESDIISDAITGMSVEEILKCITDAFNGKTLFEKKSIVIDHKEDK